MSAVFASLITLLGKKTAVSSTSAFAKSMMAINTGKRGINQTKSVLEQLGGSPVVTAFKSVAAKLNVMSTESQMNLFRETMELFKNPAVLIGIEAFKALMQMSVDHISLSLGVIDKAYILLRDQLKIVAEQRLEQGVQTGSIADKFLLFIYSLGITPSPFDEFGEPPPLEGVGGIGVDPVFPNDPTGDIGAIGVPLG